MQQGELICFGTVDYAAMRQRQLARVDAVVTGQAPPTLFLGNHPHVITSGRRGSEANVLFGELPGLERPTVIEVERGGDVTYHGPGQLIAYPILPLIDKRRDLHRYLRDLEEVIILTLAQLGLAADRQKDLTGVWTGARQARRKLASIGVAVRRWVTYHGLAINVSTDLRYFQLLNPCGLQASVMSSINEATGKSLQPGELIAPLCAAFCQVFEVNFEPRPSENVPASPSIPSLRS